VYFAHGWHLALLDSALLRDSVEAWPYGPVIPALYHEFKRWGNQPIRGRATKIDLAGRALLTPAIDAECVSDRDADAAKTIIRRVWAVYGQYSGVQLSALTHQPGTPWAVTREKYPEKRDPDIDDDLIRDYFRSRVQNGETQLAASAR
jgi:uncharacterized phage-associated protein